MLNENTPELFAPKKACTVIVMSEFDGQTGFVRTERLVCFRPPDDPDLRSILHAATIVPTEVIYPVMAKTLERIDILLAGLPKTGSVRRRTDDIRKIVKSLNVIDPARTNLDEGEEHF